MNFEIPKLAWIKAVMMAAAKFESEDENDNKLIGVVMPVRT